MRRIEGIYHSVTTPYGQVGSARNFQIYQKGCPTNLSVVGYFEIKKVRHFWSYLPIAQQKFCTGEMSSVNFDVFAVCFSIRPYVSRKEQSISVHQLSPEFAIGKHTLSCGFIRFSKKTYHHRHVAPRKNIPILLQAGFLILQTLVLFGFFFYTKVFSII